jgi:hypothetical protein
MSVPSSELGAQGFEGAMPIYPKRSGRPSGNRCSLCKRLRLECEMLEPALIKLRRD